MNAIIQNAPVTAETIANGIQHTVTGEYAVDTSRGTRDGRLSSQWCSRPDDQRHLSKESLLQYVTARSQDAVSQIVETRNMHLVPDNNEGLAIEYVDGNGRENRVLPNHHSFGQLCALTNSPAGFLRDLPAPYAAVPLQYRVQNTRELVKTYSRPDNSELLAVNGPDYGRVKDMLFLREIFKCVPDHWKIPGQMNWAKGTYNPFVEVTRESTSLYASDHDVFGFLCDDTHPIEIGKLANGDPDLLFPGMMFWNGEFGGTTMGADFFYLRGVCMNRNLWGVEEGTKISIRHTKNAPLRLQSQVIPKVLEFSNQGAIGVVGKVSAAREAIVATADDERANFFAKWGFGKKQTVDILATHLREEDRPVESVWDAVNAVTAVARKIEHADSRVAMERVAGAMMDKVSA